MGHAQNAIANLQSQHPTYAAGSTLAANRFNALVNSGRRYCQHVPPTPNPDGYYRTVLVIENEPGYFCMDVYTKDLRRAERDASKANQFRGLTEDAAVHIVCSSIKAQINRNKKR